MLLVVFLVVVVDNLLRLRLRPPLPLLLLLLLMEQPDLRTKQVVSERRDTVR